MDSTYDWCEPDPEWDEWDRYDRATHRQYAYCIAAERADTANQWNPEVEDAKAPMVSIKEHKQKLLN
jgi:hypothetical protein